MPQRSNQRLHGIVGAVVGQTPYGAHQFPLPGSGCIGFQMVLYSVCYLLHKILQIVLQLNRNVVHIKLAFFGIT